jgi:hypothetical protein
MGFLLAPSLQDVPVPADVKSHVTIQLPLAPPAMALPVQLSRPVRASDRILRAAVPVEQVFATPAEARRFREAPFSRADPAGSLSLAMLFGLTAYTPSGPVRMDAIADGFVITEDVVPETVAAACAVLLRLDSGWAVVDAGVQAPPPGPPAKGAEPPGPFDLLRADPGDLAARAVAGAVARRIDTHVVDEVVLGSATPPRGHVLPALGETVAIGNVTVSGAQLDDAGVKAAIERLRTAQPRMRQVLAERLAAKLDADRATLELAFPIAPNESYREQRWRTWRQAQVHAVLQGVAPPRLTLAGEGAAPGTVLGELVTEADVRPSGPVTDLMDVDWVPSDEEILYLRGPAGDDPTAQSLGLASAAGLMYKPAEARAPVGRVVPGLRPAGPTGATPGAAVRASPWLGVPAVGKEGLVLVRTNRGTGLLFDVGGARRFLPLRALARVQARLRLAAIEHIAVTHPHTDHVRNLLEVIRAHAIHASRLVIADSWLVGRTRLADAIRLLAATTDPVLTGWGYGSTWRPGTAVARTGFVRGSIALPDGQALEYLAVGEAHGRYATAHGRTATGTQQPRRVASSLADSASLVYLLGNRTTSHRVAVLGDMRGSDVVALHEAMERAAPGSFRAAFEQVRVLVGFGHHFGPDAGTTVADVRGLELILKETLLRTGELTIVIQSDPTRALTEPTARGGGASRLLEFARGAGARIVMANEPGPGGRGSVEINTRLQVSARGEGVEVFTGSPTPSAALRRLGELREALRLMTSEPELARNLLGLQDTPPEAIRAQLGQQIQRLERLMSELIEHRAVRLLEARRGEGVSDAELARFRAARSSRPIETIHRDLNVVEGIEARLQPAARTHLQGWRVGRTVTLEALTLTAPRAVADLYDRMPAEQRQTLRQAYEQYNRIAEHVDPHNVTAQEQLQLLKLAEDLVTELRRAAEGTAAAERRPLEIEIERLTTVVEDLRRDVATEKRFGRAPGGQLTETQFRVQRGIAAVSKAMGPVFGTVMVVHSIQGLDALTQRLAMGEVEVPEAALRAAGSAYGLHLGVQMIRMRHVGLGKLVVLALLDIGATAAGTYATTEDRDIAVAQAVAHNSLNLICMTAGSYLVSAGAASMNPVTALGLAAIGGVVMFAAEPILRLTGLDSYLIEALSFPPRQVTRVHREIEELLEQYEVMVGMRQLGERTPDELRTAGAKHPELLQFEAFGELHERARASRELEGKIMGQFDSAYTRARTSFHGLRELDVLAHRFTRLRHLAKHTPEHGADPGRDALTARFLAIDRGLDLSDADDATIRGLEQWSKIDAKFDECHRNLLGPRRPDVAAVTESFRELGWMIANARYRLDPAEQGQWRMQPLLRKGSRARAVYEGELHDREHRLGRYIELTGRLAAGEEVALTEDARRYMAAEYLRRRIARHDFITQQRLMAPVRADAELLAFGPAQADVPAVLTRLATVRRQYDAVLHAASAAMPELARTTTWADPELYARTARQALTTHAALLRRLELAEGVLHAALAHANAQLAIGEGSNPDRAKLLAIELESARTALTRRRFVLGIPLPGELDVTVRERQALDDAALAVALGQPPGAPQLTPEEARALGAGRVRAAGGRQVSTPSAQLAALDALQAAAGVAPTGRREVYRIEGDYDVTDLFVLSIVHRHVSASENVIVGATGNRRGGQMSGRGHFDKVEVLPLNRAAVTLFGSTAPRYVPSYLLARVDPKQLPAP